MISFKEYVAQKMENKKIEMTESLRHAFLHGIKPKPIAETIREVETTSEAVIEAVKAAPIKKVTVRELLQRGGMTLKKLKNGV